MLFQLLIYSLFCFFLFFLSAKISYKFKLVDLPNERKIHSKPTVYTGGIILSFIFLFTIQALDIFDPNLALIISISFLISIVGFIDDKYHLNTGGKLSLQVIPIFYLIVFGNFSLTNIGNYNYFDLELGTFALPFTLLCVLFLTNAFNYFDGLDGTLGLTIISVMCILVFLSHDKNFNIFLLILIIPLSVFLFFNFSFLKLPKIFLGDSGSLLLGFIVSFLLIYLAKKNVIHPILLAWSVVIFVYEFLSINLIRLKNNQSLFKAGQDHLHHFLLKKTKSIFFTNTFIFLLNLILFFLGYFSYLIFNPFISLILFITLFIVFLIFRNNLIKYNK